MGLFDGATAPTGEGAGDPGFSSTAHVAGLLGAPVVLVIDASAAGRSVAAVATGFDRFDPGTTVAGVILNQVGSDRHEQLLRDALAAAGFPVFGAIRRSDEVSAPSRHLGLIPVAERSADATEATARLGALIAASCDLPALLALARSAPDLPGPAWAPPELPHPGGRPVVAVAGGAAFTFSYTEHSELLAAAGLDVVPFDPLRDEALPDGHGRPGPGRRLPGNARQRPVGQRAPPPRRRGRRRPRHPGRRRVRRPALPGPHPGRRPHVRRPPHRRHHDRPASPSATAKPRAATDSVLAATGEVVRAHEFHRTETDPESGPAPAWLLASPNPQAPPTPQARPPQPRPHRAPPQKHPPPHQPHQSAKRATSPGTCTRPTCTSTGPGYPQVAARFAAACRAAAKPAGPAMTTLIGVGVGPGDPELVTVKAVRVLREADVVFVPVMAGPGRRPAPAGPRPRSALTSRETGSARSRSPSTTPAA